MFRRVVSTLVVLGLFASHLAVVPHVHAGMQPTARQEHDATPHFHLPFGGGIHAGHSHDHHHTHAHSHVGGSHHASDCAPIWSGAGGSDHDADAVYLPETFGAPAITNVDNIAAASSHFSPLHTLAIWLSHSGANANTAPHWHPPELMGDAAPLYLTLRTLRI
jgi:hypothetical protein